MDDRIETRAALHRTDDGDLHFRFTGTARNRRFIVDVRFMAADDRTAQKPRPEEYDFMIGKVADLILKHLGETPNPALH